MKILIEFFPIGPTYPLYKMFKTLWMGYTEVFYDMIEARIVI